MDHVNSSPPWPCRAMPMTGRRWGHKANTGDPRRASRTLFAGAVNFAVLIASLFGPFSAGPATAASLCASPRTFSETPATADCLLILRSAIGAAECYPRCACDPDSEAGITVTDALLCLRAAVRQPTTLACNCPPEAPLIGSAEITPGEHNVLSAVVRFETTIPTLATVTVHGPDGVWTPPRSGYQREVYSKEHEVWLLGLSPDTDYTVNMEGRTAAGDSTGVVSESHRTGTLPYPRLPIRVPTRIAHQMSPGVTLFNISGAPWGPALYIVDENGTIRWYRDGIGRDVRRMQNGNLLGCHSFDRVNADILELDMMGNIVRSIPDLSRPELGRSFHHECSEMKNGNILTLSVELREIGGYFDGLTHRVVGDRILEVTWDGTVVNELSLLDILDPFRVKNGFDLNFYDAALGGPTKDWSHANAVIHDPADDSYIVSVRHQDIVVKISRTGDLVWVLGEDDPATQGDDHWPFLGMDGPGEYPNHQHAPQITSRGTLLLYDNANATRLTRPVEYLIDEDSLTVRQVWEWFDEEIDPPLYAHFVGDADELPGNNVLVTHGGRNVDPAVERGGSAYLHMVEIHRETDTKVWEMIVRDEAAVPRGSRGYRAERLRSLYP